jgi:putative ABC transport system permease protein
VEKVKRNHLGEKDPAGAFYVPLSQVPLGSFRLALGVEPEGPEVWAEVRSRIASLDPGLILTSPTTLEESLASSLTLQRVPMLLLSTFAAVGLFLGALGIYGVIGHLGASRRREVALRMAIGGTPGRIVTLLGREWLGVVGWGLVAGLVAAAGSARILEALLYGTGPLNPLIVIAALGTLLAVAVVACVVPLRRAMTVDPAVVLREG